MQMLMFPVKRSGSKVPVTDYFSEHQIILCVLKVVANRAEKMSILEHPEG